MCYIPNMKRTEKSEASYFIQIKYIHRSENTKSEKSTYRHRHTHNSKAGNRAKKASNDELLMLLLLFKRKRASENFWNEDKVKRNCFLY